MNGMRELDRLSAADLSALLAAREVSAVELATHFLERVGADRLNAFIDVRPDLTLDQARAADRRLAQGERGPLLGVPVAHKDIFVTRGWRSTAASRMLADYVSPFDATVVERLSTAGAVCLGKTNCDEFAMGSANENSHFGPVLNPWDPAAIPGGSSGGSAAAVAAGLAPLATGTDTGGSVRQPAAMCGITGIKPGYGRVSRYGMIAYASSLDQAGAMGRSARDCATLLSAMVGFDPRDSTCHDRPPEDFGRLFGQPLTGLRIGLPQEFFASGLHADVRAAIERALALLEAQGARLVEVSLPRAELAIPAYYVIAPAEASSNLSRFDGVRYGHRSARCADLGELYRNSRAEGFGTEVKRRILIGTYVLSRGYYDAYYLKAQQLRRLIADEFDTALAQVDLIAAPVAPSVAWDLGSQVDDPVANYLADIYTLPASLAGLPGLSMPVGFGARDRPVGLQLIGRHLDEARLLQVADHYQQLTDWHTRLPEAQR